MIGPRSPRSRSLAMALATVACAGLLTACSSASAPEQPTPDDPVAAASDVPAPGSDRFPTMASTGPLVPQSQLQSSESVSSEEDGEVIENLDVDGQVRITHDDVVLRNVRINHVATRPGQYALLIDANPDGTCPTGVLVEHIEVVGDTAVLDDQAKAVYAPCPFTMEDSRVYDVGSAVRLTSGSVLRGNYVLANFNNEGTDSHRSGVAINGGSHNVIEGNAIACEGDGCSGAFVMYGGDARISDTLIIRNLFNTTGSYCTYAGSVESKSFPIALNVRYIGNMFGRDYFETCGRYGPVTGLNGGGGPGFVWEDNVWEETGEDVSIS